MRFNKKEIAKFKSERKSFITWRKRLKLDIIKKIFYDNNERSLEDLFPNKDIQYCTFQMYSNLVYGDYKLGIEYTNENGTYYMFLGAKSPWYSPWDVAIGKKVYGTIYLIRERFPYNGCWVCLREIDASYINKIEYGFRPRSYNSSIFMPPFNLKNADRDITDEDVKCVKIAYEGIRAFSELIKEIS